MLKMDGFTINIEKETVKNEFYRKVIYTCKKMQLVLMSLKPGEDIPVEVHHDIDQFIRIEKGKALVRINDEEFNLKEDDVVIIPAEHEHYVKNTGDNDLKLYSIYATPEHAPGTIHKTKEEADAAEHKH